MESGSPLGAVIGGFDKAFLHGITIDTLTSGNIPELTFVMFQCMFAIITPALILGAFAERIKFSGYMVFIILWVILAYFPMAHWVWGGGFLQEMGAIDFAGGTVVHVNAGISALVMAIMLGQREDYRIGHPITPHNITFVFLGTSFLWLGWFGFNAGSGLAADGLAANAFMVTHIATAVAAVTWMAIDWICNKKPTTVGACTGAVAGLVAITPAAGTVDLLGAFFIGLITPIVCFFMVAVVKPKFKYDDALDAFGVHGIGGIVGSILTGRYPTKAFHIVFVKASFLCCPGLPYIQLLILRQLHVLYLNVIGHRIFTVIHDQRRKGILRWCCQRHIIFSTCPSVNRICSGRLKYKL